MNTSVSFVIPSDAVLPSMPKTPAQRITLQTDSISDRPVLGLPRATRWRLRARRLGALTLQDLDLILRELAQPAD
jgi:hypothetical protein